MIKKRIKRWRYKLACYHLRRLRRLQVCRELVYWQQLHLENCKLHWKQTKDENSCLYPFYLLQNKYFKIKRKCVSIIQSYLRRLSFFIRKTNFIISLGKRNYKYDIVFFRRSYIIGRKRISCRFKINNDKYCYLVEDKEERTENEKYYLCDTLGLHRENYIYLKKIRYLRNKISYIIDNKMINDRVYYSRICKKKSL